MAEVAENQTTWVSEEWFRAQLPGRWEKAPNNEEHWFVYRGQIGGEQFSVTLYWLAQPMTREERKPVVESMVEMSRKAELSVAGWPPDLTDVSYGERGDTLAARYTGVEAPNRRFATLILCAPRVAYVLHYAAMGLTDDAFQERASTVTNAFLIPAA